jgi:regulator of PEP synthase PpsR (kinase-PPPase family)
LETSDARRVNPARVVSDSFGQHAASLSQSLSDQFSVTFKPFYDLEQHEQEFTSQKPFGL